MIDEDLLARNVSLAQFLPPPAARQGGKLGAILANALTNKSGSLFLTNKSGSLILTRKVA